MFYLFGILVLSNVDLYLEYIREVIDISKCFLFILKLKWFF